jgi:hypothetical protein
MMVIQSNYNTNNTPSQQDIDTLAREYIRSLEKGIMPEDRPDSFEKWEIYIGEIEHFFFDHERDKDLPKKMAEHIRNYCKDHQDLARLLRRSTNQEDIDQAAREYILSFKKGVFPFDRLENFGQWESVITQIEDSWTKARGDKEKLSDMIDSLCKFKTELKELLEDYEDPVQGGNDSPVVETEDIPVFEYALPPVNLSNSLFAYTYDETVKFSATLSPEGYEWFHHGTFFATCSSIAMRRLAIDFSDPLYTNLYIALSAKSSVWNKSTSKRVIERITKSLSLEHILHSGEETPQFFI